MVSFVAGFNNIDFMSHTCSREVKSGISVKFKVSNWFE